MATTPLDVALADALIDRIDMNAWLRVAEPSQLDKPDTPVLAAIFNLRRVLDDLLLVFGYDLEMRQGDVWWVRK